MKKKKKTNRIKIVGVAMENIGKGAIAVVEIDHNEKIVIISNYKSDSDFLNLTSDKMKK
jgi:hypothetical protein